jgi:DAACS family dicarboxylate/amino acid:cation (Na+ or H+) symporter
MKLHSKMALGLVAGAASGAAANLFFPGAVWVLWIVDHVAVPVGQVFLRLLLMTVVPLVFASITLAVGSLGDLGKLGRLGARTITLFLLSTAASTAIGLGLVNLVQPGRDLDDELRRQLVASYATQAEALTAPAPAALGIGMILEIVPRNVVQAAAEMDMLAVIFFSITLGAALTRVPAEKSRQVLGFLDGLNDAILVIIGFAMRLAPYGVFALIFTVTARFGWHLLGQLAVYVAVVLVGLLLHATISLSALVGVLGRFPPALFWWRARASLVTAFSTSSSNATLPTNIAVAERQLNVPPEIAGFVLPLGATMNMNGTALYEGVTVLFLAQVFGIELGLGQQVVVLVLAVMTAVGSAGVPGGSLPLMMTVLGAVGVPPEAIAIILGVDRILDMSRTCVNVCGDLAVAVVVARLEGAVPLSPAPSATAGASPGSSPRHGPA